MMITCKQYLQLQPTGYDPMATYERAQHTNPRAKLHFVQPDISNTRSAVLEVKVQQESRLRCSYSCNLDQPAHHVSLQRLLSRKLSRFQT
jgi:hypothetical protein